MKITKWSNCETNEKKLIVNSRVVSLLLWQNMKSMRLSRESSETLSLSDRNRKTIQMEKVSGLNFSTA